MMEIPKGAWLPVVSQRRHVISRYCQRTRNLLHLAHFDKIKQSQTELVFLHLLLLLRCLNLILSLLVLFYSASCET